MTSDDMSMLGVDGIRRSFDEHYDTMMDVEQDPCGAHHAIHNQHARIEELEAERDEALNQLDSARHSVEVLEANVARLREALTPSGDTKAAYMSKIECDCPTENWRHYVPWTSIKEIMKMVRARAALQDKGDA